MDNPLCLRFNVSIALPDTDLVDSGFSVRVIDNGEPATAAELSILNNIWDKYYTLFCFGPRRFDNCSVCKL